MSLPLTPQVMAEVQSFLKLLGEVYDIFGLDYSMALSTRPEGYLGELELWNKAEKALEEALNTTGRPWTVNEGEFKCGGVWGKCGDSAFEQGGESAGRGAEHHRQALDNQRVGVWKKCAGSVEAALWYRGEAALDSTGRPWAINPLKCGKVRGKAWHRECQYCGHTASSSFPLTISCRCRCLVGSGSHQFAECAQSNPASCLYPSPS